MSTKRICFSLGIVFYFLVFRTSVVHSQPIDEASKSRSYAARMVVMLRGNIDDTPVFGAGIIFGFDSNNVYIVTANHVLRRGSSTAEKIVVAFHEIDNLYPAVVQNHYSPELDIAVLSVRRVSVEDIDFCLQPYNRLARENNKPTRGTAVYSIGNPNGIGWAMPVVPDYVAKIDDSRIIVQSNFVAPGSSGGALVDDIGTIVGMVLADTPPFLEANLMLDVISKLEEWGYPVALNNRHYHGARIWDPVAWNPLFTAVVDKDIKKVRKLISYGCTPGSENSTFTLYYLNEIDRSMLTTLLEAGADPNDGLVNAIRHDDYETLNLLFTYGANFKDKWGAIALKIAIQEKKDDAMVSFLLKKGISDSVEIDTMLDSLLPNTVSKNVTNVMLAAIDSNMNKEIATRYIQKSIQFKNDRLLDWFITKGADINVLLESGNTIFDWIERLDYRDRNKIINKVIDAGLDVKRLDRNGAGITHFLLAKHSLDDETLQVVSKVLTRGADPNQRITEISDFMRGWARDRQDYVTGATPLLFLLLRVPNENVVNGVKILLNAGADTTLKNKAGRTASDLVWNPYPLYTPRDNESVRELKKLLPRITVE